ncbi:prenyltransferase/squalene oxidase repeat-containing protein [Paludisphaera mucosa]|uniref:Terpene cyclase/mutase family protein n=1 Tax=Paludisphaera mucosa TaxID=3030827 RepID=A0ABT6FCG1_9BACT|nr:prenyltransferase/squalene oxidase repeat-containing protein [Paludisphaera mucosa]MDG3005222.1 terpene cyclase/mutase family protein [Paludisphaera mucosa]
MRLRELPLRILERVGRAPLAWEGRDIDPGTLRSVPSWGVSLLLHAFALLLLAFLIQHGRVVVPERTFTAELPPGEIADLTSLVEADRSGDPFTDRDDPNPPSMSLGPADPAMKLANQPEIPGLVAFAPDPAGPAPKRDLASSLMGTAPLAGLAANVQAPFSGRSGLGRAELVRREGGTVHSEKSVEDGLAWIVRHQKSDGSWVLNVNDVCQTCPAQQTVISQTGATGLALLPLLGAGYSHTVKSRHQASVRRGLEWLCANQQENGDLHVGGTGISYLYSHAIAAMALCEAYGVSRDPQLQEPARRAIAFIAEAQDPETGGWRYRPGQAGDTSVFGWNIFALRSANLAGLKVPNQTLRGCNDYLNLASVDGKKVMYAYQPNREASPVMTAEALVGRQLMGWSREHPSLIKGAGRVAAHLEKSEDRNIYYWYYATQLLHNMRNKDWERWNPHVREALIRTQIHDDGCPNGSWDPAFPSQDRWGATGGRLFQTSLSILTLEVYYRYLPLYRTADEESMDEPPPPLPLPAEAEAKAEKKI